MSFFDTLQQMGLFKGGQQPAQLQQNPYGLDQQAMRQVGWQTLGNIGSQIMALSQQMTPAQRAAMMARADFTGGMQQNLFNAAQMKLLQDKRQKEGEQDEREKAAKAYVAQTLQAMPDGPAKQKAMAYMQLGDIPKAVEALYAATERKAPDLKTVRVGDKDVTYQWNDGTGTWEKFGEGVAFKPEAPAKPNYQYKDGYLINMDDPSASAVKVQGLPEQQGDPQLEQTQLQNNRSAAQTLTSDFEAGSKSYDTIIGAGQRATQVAVNPNMSAADKLTTLYQFMKALDPDGAVREGDVEMAQAMQGFIDRYGQMVSSAVSGGGPISEGMVLDMARSMARLANDAAARKERKRISMIRLAQGRQIPMEMVSPDLNGGSQNMQAPIGLRIPALDPLDRLVPTGVLTPDEEAYVKQNFGG